MYPTYTLSIQRKHGAPAEIFFYLTTTESRCAHGTLRTTERMFRNLGTRRTWEFLLRRCVFTEAHAGLEVAIDVCLKKTNDAIAFLCRLLLVGHGEFAAASARGAKNNLREGEQV